MDEQHGEVEDVGVGHEAVEERGQRPEEGQHDLRNVVEVPGQPPPARGQQDGLPALAALQLVPGAQDQRLAAPHQALAVTRAHRQLLLVRVVVDVDGQDPQGRDQQRQRQAQHHGLLD